MASKGLTPAKFSLQRVNEMSLREKINVLITQARYDELVNMALRDKGAIKYILRHLYHPFGIERWQAIEGLGRVCAALVHTEPETVKELIRRLLWSMNDESGTTGWSAPEAIGEIIYRCPDKFQEFISIVVHASEEEIFHRGIAWALGRIGQLRPEMVQEFIPLLISFTGHTRPEVRGYAAWALGQIGASEAVPKLAQLQHDHAQVELYEKQKIIYKSVGQLASTALHQINNRIS
ncbi:PBS lyase HEAT domain protein repeat-containing protein [Desulfotomaculum nigrificans CO-1-SRB]|uniref:PBS lyase HEAT domain protein repeat-containing protein n=2 Tax=Desulfotomaculum nigrificans TaxID=1565 RepID=F6B701_DESCC|nr:PBS lyase HEAT domain protein repeat-containing protein [Desulfotomaculum nigrificans CO-1-SRB]